MPEYFWWPWCLPHESNSMEVFQQLTHWGRVTHICVGNLTIISLDNGLSPGRRQAIIWTNAEILLIGPLRTNFSEILIAIETFPFKKKHLKMSSGKCQPFCLSLNVLPCSLVPGICGCHFRCQTFKHNSKIANMNNFCRNVSWMPHNHNDVKIYQYWFRMWLSVIGQQANTWTNVDKVLRYHMASQADNNSDLPLILHWCHSTGSPLV